MFSMGQYAETTQPIIKRDLINVFVRDCTAEP